MFRILTEEKNVEQLKASLNGLGLDFTLFCARGSWHGQEENSLAIELDNVTRSLAESTARTIKSMNKQEAALLQEIPVVSTLRRSRGSFPEHLAGSPLGKAKGPSIGTFAGKSADFSWRRRQLQNRLQCCSGKKKMRG